MASFKDKARKQLGIKTNNDEDIEHEIIGGNSNKRVNAGPAYLSYFNGCGYSYSAC